MRLDSHHIAQVLVRPAARVLDVGCGDGTVAKLFLETGCSVVGLDVSDEAIDRMADLGLTAHRLDLDTDSVGELLGDARFDVIVCLDVLEHTKSPSDVLNSLLGHLEPDGDLVISLPNVTHGDVRISLLEGRFRYRDEGLLDATHLRFFDRPGVDALLEQTGLVMRELCPVRFPLGATELGVDESAIPAEVKALIEGDDQGDIYQWVFRAQRLDASDGPPPLHPLLTTIVETQEALGSAERYVDRVVAELAAAHGAAEEAAAHTASVERELQNRDTRIGDLQEHADHRESELLEDLELLRREVAAKDDVVALLATENDHLRAAVTTRDGEVARLSGELAAIRGRRVYRGANALVDVLTKVPGLGRLVKRLLVR